MNTDDLDLRKNPPEKITAFLSPIIIIAFIIFGLLFLFFVNALFTIWTVVFLSISGIYFILFLYVGWKREYRTRPMEIRIVNEGIELHDRDNSIRLLKWSDIQWIDANPGNPSTLFGRWMRDGMIKTEDDTYIPLTYEVAIMARSAYFKHFGISPFTRYEYLKQKRTKE